MDRAVEGRCAGAEAAARDGGHPPASLREAELPVCRRGVAPRAGGAQLLRGKQDEVRGAARGVRRASAPGHRTLSPGADASRGGGERRAGRAGEQPRSQPPSDDAFSASKVLYDGLIAFLCGGEAARLTHEQLEFRLDRDGRGLIRQLLQDHLDLRAGRERRAVGVSDAGGVTHNAVEADHRRVLETIFGEVTVTRLAYRAKAVANLYLADAALNLPKERHSHGLRERCAIEAARGSYEEATRAISKTTGVELGKRQVEALAARASVDFDAFYEHRERPAASDGEVVVISVDGKGVVMRREGLRPQTAQAAQKSNKKLKGRLSKGEKTNRKRMAEVGAVYTVTPMPRTPEDVMARSANATAPNKAPKAAHKWLTASVVEDATTVIAKVFDEAQRRDPKRRRDWVALIDGNNHQIDRINAEAKARGIEVAIVVDWVHVLEYLWSAAWSFHAEGDPAAEDWVDEKALEVLAGRASIVAAAIRRKATMLGLDDSARKNADACADYLLAKVPYLDYPTALSSGWPIATGVIEGAVRHVVKDRMDITGARWGLDGAEAVLKLRALRANSDWEDYWSFHLAEEHKRIHQSRYFAHSVPTAA
jgi:hypothetical protein